MSNLESKTDDVNVDVWLEFLERYYWDDLVKLAINYPSQRSLVIRYDDVYQYNIELADKLIDQPDKILKDVYTAILGIDFPAPDIELKDIHVRVGGLPEKIRRRDIRHESINKLISVDGVVHRVSEVTPKIINAAFKCQRCEHITYVSQTDDKFIEPFECENEICQRKGAFKIIHDKSEKVDYQKIRIQEPTEDLRGGEKSQTIDVDIFDDLTGVVLPGNKITITGILRSSQRVKAGVKQPYEDLYIDAVHIHVRDSQETVVLTPEDKHRLKTLSDRQDIIEHLVNNFAPTIFGMRDLKEGILCSAVSSGYGVRYDGTPQREYSHILVCADPGVGKSNIKHGLKAIIPKLILSSGTGSTKAGLTAAVIKDDFAGGSFSVEAGALVLADCGGIALDEFDKFNKDDIRNLNDALSNCQFEIDKAGFHLKLWSRCFVVAFQNPKDGRFDSDRPPTTQINIPPDTLSRFDLIFTLRDQVNEKRDPLVGGNIFDAWTGVQEHIDNSLIIEDFQKYIAYAQSIQPIIPVELRQVYLDKYTAARRRSSDDRIAVTARYMEALIRLSKAEAKLTLSDTVTSGHLERAVRLLDVSLSQVSVDEEGRLDSDIIATGKSKSQRDKIQSFVNIIRLISENHRGVAPMQEVILESVKNGLSEKDIVLFIKNLKTVGDIYEPSEGYLKVV